ncbi:NYN domain-containing protein [Planctomicrobium sp. SH664]|uniref:NYN domain-containing protein n=1 Tax=Planctomicrobium sp. SH664 TaxID=3448125 RepID=UPI003F5B1D62
MSIDFLIDGYNLLHAAGFARARYGPGDLERARDRLLKLLRRLLTAEELQRTTIVFDARDAQHVSRQECHPWGMTVLFSPSGREADDVIEDLVHGHFSPRQLIVVSSDHRLQRVARVCRAQALDSDQFLDQLEDRLGREQQAQTAPQRSGERPREVSDEELQRWLKEFESIDVDSIRRGVNKELRSPSPASSPPPAPAPAKPTTPPLPSGNPLPAGKLPSPTPVVQQPEANEEGGAPQAAAIDADELSFWEQRVRDLLRGEEML